jgi:hypothetical protein
MLTAKCRMDVVQRTSSVSRPLSPLCGGAFLWYIAKHPPQHIARALQSPTYRAANTTQMWTRVHHCIARLHASRRTSIRRSCLSIARTVGGLQEKDRGEVSSDGSCSVPSASPNRYCLFNLVQPIRRVAVRAIILTLLDAEQALPFLEPRIPWCRSQSLGTRPG